MHVQFETVTVKEKHLKYFLWFFFPRFGPPESSCGRNLDDLIQSLGAASLSAEEALPDEAKALEELEEQEEKAAVKDEEVKELEPEEEAEGESGEEDDEEEKDEKEEEEGLEESELMPSLEEEEEEEEDVTNIEEVGATEPASGLRRRNRPEWTGVETFALDNDKLLYVFITWSDFLFIIY